MAPVFLYHFPVVKTQNSKHVMQGLLDETRDALYRGRYDHLGSSALWKGHGENLARMQNTLNNIQIKEVYMQVIYRGFEFTITCTVHNGASNR